MKKIVILLIFIVSVFSYSKNEDFTKIVVEAYPNGNPKTMVLYDKNDVPQKEIRYYENGNMHLEREVKNGKYEGEINLYYPNGKLHEKSYMRDGEYVDGFIGYYESGNVQIKSIIDGNKDSYVRFFENGTIEEKGQRENGLRQGKIFVYYESGKIRSEEDYTDDVLNGIWKEYSEDGTVNFVKKIKMGILVK